MTTVALRTTSVWTQQAGITSTQIPVELPMETFDDIARLLDEYVDERDNKPPVREIDPEVRSQRYSSR